MNKPSVSARPPVRLAILGSTRGSNLVPILAAVREGRLHAEIAVVISNRDEAMILQRAKDASLPTLFIDPVGLSREEYDKKLHAVLAARQIDLIVLIGYMRILSPWFVSQWASKIINVHPSLLPAFAGLMNLDVHRAVLAEGALETGCTVHYVTAEVDAGPILVQKRCSVLAGDTPESLRDRVQLLEGDALIEAIASKND